MERLHLYQTTITVRDRGDFIVYKLIYFKGGIILNMHVVTSEAQMSEAKAVRYH